LGLERSSEQKINKSIVVIHLKELTLVIHQAKGSVLYLAEIELNFNGTEFIVKRHDLLAQYKQMFDEKQLTIAPSSSLLD